MPDSHEHDLDAVSARISHTFSPMLSLHGYLGCLLTQYTPLPTGSTRRLRLARCRTSRRWWKPG